MSNEALAGVLVGVLPGAAAHLKTIGDDATRAENKAQAAAWRLSQLEGRFNQLAQRGDVLRGLFPIVQDFEAGLASAMMKVTPAGVLIPCERGTRCRPHLSKENHVAGLVWPPVVSDYSSDMLIRGAAGSLFDIGRALTYQEVQAALLGMALAEEPDDDEVVQIYRAFQALTKRFAALGYTQAQFDAQVEALFPRQSLPTGSTAAVNYSRLLDIIQADSSTISNTTTETAFDKTLSIPAGVLAVGRAIRFFFGVRIPSGNSTDTLELSVRLGSASGTALLTGSAVDVGNSGAYAVVSGMITRRPDVGGAAQVVVQGMAGTDTGLKGGGLAQTGIDFQNSAQSLVLTATWSVASASNQAILAGGTAELV